MLKTDPNQTKPVRFEPVLGSDYINKEYYFSIQLNFWVKTGPDQTMNTRSLK